MNVLFKRVAYYGKFNDILNKIKIFQFEIIQILYIKFKIN